MGSFWSREGWLLRLWGWVGIRLAVLGSVVVLALLLLPVLLPLLLLDRGRRALNTTSLHRAGSARALINAAWRLVLLPRLKGLLPLCQGMSGWLADSASAAATRAVR